MKRKPIKIDWEELESAFQEKREDLVYYLDLVTGQVVLEGEGEDTLEDEDDVEDDVENEGARRNETTRLYIEPPGPEEEAEWMDDFVEEAKEADPSVRDRLREALDRPDPTEAFREFLRHHAEERDRWFLYRSDRIHEAIDSWLDSNEVQSIEPPPWHG